MSVDAGDTRLTGFVPVCQKELSLTSFPTLSAFIYAYLFAELTPGFFACQIFTRGMAVNAVDRSEPRAIYLFDKVATVAAVSSMVEQMGSSRAGPLG